MAHVIVLPLVVSLIYCGKKCPKVRCLSNRAENYMFWSGSMRFFTEGYLDFCMFSLLNLKYLDWSDKFPIVTACNYVAIFMAALACLLPLFVLIWYVANI